jgi:hypothetical protein
MCMLSMVCVFGVLNSFNGMVCRAMKHDYSLRCGCCMHFKQQPLDRRCMQADVDCMLLKCCTLSLSVV